MNNFIKSLCFIYSLLLAADNEMYLWDLGMKINSSNTMNQQTINKDITEKKQALLSNRMIKPKKITMDVDVNSSLREPGKDVNVSIENLSNTEKLHIGEQFYFSGRYIAVISFLDKIDFQLLDKGEKEKLIYYYLDSLYNLGKYERVVEILSKSTDTHVNDEMLFLLGMSSLKCNEDKVAIQAFDELVNLYPNSEYSFLSNLQSKIIKRR